MKKRATILLALLLAILILGNPNELQYLSRLQADFGDIHHGVTMTKDQLNSMGSSRYQSWLFASHYEYRFGTIKVSYFGIGFMKFYLGSSTKTSENSEPQTTIT